MVCLNIHRETKQYKLAGFFLITIDREAKEKLFSFLKTDAFLHKFFSPGLANISVPILGFDFFFFFLTQASAFSWLYLIKHPQWSLGKV